MNKRKFDLPSFLLGVCITFVFCAVLVAIVMVSGGTTAVSKADKTTEETETTAETKEKKEYDIMVSEKEVTLTSGEKFTFKLPMGYYSLTDQYLESIGNYYNAENVQSDTMYVVGDNREQTLADTIINMDIMSDLPNVFSQLYGEDYEKNEIGKSTAYQYMKTGKIPEDAEEDYKIEEIDKFTVSDITFTVYAVSYTTKYKDDEDKEQSIKTKEIDCYSDTEDPIEIVLYQTDYDKVKAVELIHEFCGYEK